MLEFHGWITIRETYEVRDDEEEGLDRILQNIRNRIQYLHWNKPDLKVRNGEWYIEISLFANRKTEQTIELFDFFTYIANLATGSYGVIYMLDDEDINGKNNEFQVFSISRGKLHEHKDTLLSPFVSIVEDTDI